MDEKLFLSYVKPFKEAVKICTIARWLKEVLRGMSLSNFNAHSTRGASVSAAFDKGLSISDIIRVADWSSDSMFKKYYYKPIVVKTLLTSLFMPFILVFGDLNPSIYYCYIIHRTCFFNNIIYII